MPAAVVDTLLGTLAGGNPDLPHDTWDRIDTAGLADLVAHEQCGLWLYRQLKRKDLLDAVEPGLRTWLEKDALRVVATNHLVDVERDRLVGILNAERIPFILLKGAARRLVNADSPLADARSMVDVDVLLPPDRIQQAWDLLLESGFSRTSAVNTTPAEWVHLPPLSYGDGGIGVELHDRTQRNLTPATAWERVSHSAREIEYNGLTASVPHTTELFWHTLYHALYHGADGFKLRYLLDGVSLLGDPALDLEVVERRLAADEAGCRPHGGRAWMHCVTWLASGGKGDVPGRYGLKQMLRWSLMVFRKFPLDGRVGSRAVGEARRVELGIGRQAYVRGSGPLLRARRFLGATAVRSLYRTWRARHRN